MKTQKDFIEIISILVGIISLAFAIYQTQNIALKIGFAVATILSATIFFIYALYNKIQVLVIENRKTNNEMIQLKEKLDIYDRLNKIEHKLSTR